jgi:hypothetical protein
MTGHPNRLKKNFARRAVLNTIEGRLLGICPHVERFLHSVGPDAEFVPWVRKNPLAV